MSCFTKSTIHSFSLSARRIVRRNSPRARLFIECPFIRPSRCVQTAAPFRYGFFWRFPPPLLPIWIILYCSLEWDKTGVTFTNRDGRYGAPRLLRHHLRSIYPPHTPSHLITHTHSLLPLTLFRQLTSQTPATPAARAASLIYSSLVHSRRNDKERWLSLLSLLSPSACSAPPTRWRWSRPVEGSR